MTERLLDDLRAALDPARVRSGPTELSLYRSDASSIDGGAASVVCLPETTTEVQSCVLIANEHGVSFFRFQHHRLPPADIDVRLPELQKLCFRDMIISVNKKSSVKFFLAAKMLATQNAEDKKAEELRKLLENVALNTILNNWEKIDKTEKSELDTEEMLEEWRQFRRVLP